MAVCGADYQASVPRPADRFARDDLVAERPTFSCLDRLRPRDNRQMVGLRDPSGGLRLVGALEAPGAGFRPAPR